MCTGIGAELAGVDLGDQRLNRRSVKVIEALAANPEASINGAASGWGDTLAAYRLFDNPAVTPEKILEPHTQATLGRIQEQPVVLLVQDTTELDYTKHPPQDVRCLNTEDRLGLYQHLELAITPEQVPLGVVGIDWYDRPAETLGTRSARKQAPIEEKESYRWLVGYHRCCAIAERCPETQIICVADSEADIYDIFTAARDQTGRRADYIIRGYEDRCTPKRNPAAGPSVYHKVRDEVINSPLLTTIFVDLEETPKRKARRAQLTVRALTVTVKPPHNRPSLQTITHNVVLVEEVNGPGDDTDVCWLLLTTLPIETVADVLQVIAHYRARWSIETFFRMLKSGCTVEEIGLETKARLLNALTMYNIIAWRILYLTYLNRATPDLPCTAVFTDDEWQPVWRVVTRTALPATVPRLSDIMKLITQLGGYNNRATERPAGPQSVWIGLRRMLDYSIAWLIFGPGSCV